MEFILKIENIIKKYDKQIKIIDELEKFLKGKTQNIPGIDSSFDKVCVKSKKYFCSFDFEILFMGFKKFI